MKTPELAAALRRERADMVRFCGELDEAEWRAPSRAAGWRVQDVVAHLGSGCRAVFTPALLTIMRTDDIERTNDLFVDQRREWPSARVFAEYKTWSRCFATVSTALARTPLGRLPLPLGELGRFPAGMLLSGAMLFDHHTHLRFDIAPALDRGIPETDRARMTGVLDWMFAVLSNQLESAETHWLSYPLDIVLGGPGGGIWRVHPGGSISAGRSDGPAAATIEGWSGEFPEWATSRVCWRDRDVRIRGDADYAVRFLDDVNIV
ncbi:maleylpyruvate isomerase N-terminal domain-containing protein [Nocardia niigatensis]